MKLCTAVLACVLALAALDATAARRLGGGGSTGQQSSNVNQRDTAPGGAASNGPSKAGNQQAGAAAASPAAGTPAAPAARPWGAMLGGLAVGLGLAWLANSLGFGPALANLLLVALLAMAVLAVVGLALRSRRPALAAAPAGWAPADAARELRQYSPDKVGNDASARPFERSGIGMAVDSAPADAGDATPGSGLGAPHGWSIPPGFDVPGFVGAAKRHFMTLQEAWDRSDMETLRSMMTDGMLAEIRSQLAEREVHLGGQPNSTDVVMLEAQLLGIEDLGHDYLASVEFSGMIREQPSAGPAPFREVWNMTKPKSGASGWLVAGVQALA